MAMPAEYESANGGGRVRALTVPGLTVWQVGRKEETEVD